MIQTYGRLFWSDELVTGDNEIDTTHREFVTLANALVDADDNQLLSRLLAFEVHAKAHFAAEDQMMLEHPYPSAGCHFDEHKAVLASIAEVIPLVAAGKWHVGRSLAAELIRWFPAHTEEMDKSFVRWRLSNALGGAPVKIHRNTKSQTAT